MTYVTPNALDAELNYIKNNAETLHLCSQEPANYAEVATYSLGNYAGPSIVGPVAGDTNGRKITVEAIESADPGTITAVGLATHWVLVKDSATSELLSSQELGAPKNLTGDTFTLTASDLENPIPVQG